MRMVLHSNPQPGDVVTIAGNKELVFREGAWRLRQSSIIQETSGLDYGKLINVPATFTPSAHSHSYASLTGKPTEFTPAAHSHEREIRANFTGDFTVGQGKAIWYPARPTKIVGIYLQLTEAALVDVTVDVLINGTVSALQGTEVKIVAGHLVTTRIDLNKDVIHTDAIRVDVLNGAGKNLTVVLIYKD